MDMKAEKSTAVNMIIPEEHERYNSGIVEREGSVRDAAVTRGAILDAAGKLFTLNGYKQAGVREIARTAGVTAGLINRYFGSKEKLLYEVMFNGEYPSLGLLIADRTRFGETLARFMITKPQNPNGVDPVLILLRSIGDPGAARVISAHIERWIEPLVTELRGIDAKICAEMIASTLGGFVIFRTILRTEALADADSEDLVKLLGRTLQSFVNGKAEAGLGTAT